MDPDPHSQTHSHFHSHRWLSMPLPLRKVKREPAHEQAPNEADHDQAGHRHVLGLGLSL